MIATYRDLQAAASNWLVRADLCARATEFIGLAEARLQRTFGEKFGTLSLSAADPVNALLRDYPDAYLFATLCEAGPFLRDVELASAYEARLARAIGEINAREVRASRPRLASEAPPLVATPPADHSPSVLPGTAADSSQTRDDLIERLRRPVRSRNEGDCQNCDDALKAEAADALVVLMAVRDGQRATIRGAIAAKQADKARLDWLETHTVEVRDPLVYGSRHVFFANPDDSVEGEEGPSDIRAKIDRYLSREAPPVISSEASSGKDTRDGQIASLEAEVTPLNEADARALLRHRLGAQSAGSWAKANGLAPQQVDSFLRGERPLEPRLATVLGLRRVSYYLRENTDA